MNSSSFVRWSEIRAELVEQARGDQAVKAGTQELLAQVIGHRLAEGREARGLTQQQIAEWIGVTKDRVSQIELGRVSAQDVVAGYAATFGGRPHQAIYFDDGDIAAI